MTKYYGDRRKTLNFICNVAIQLPVNKTINKVK